MAKIDPLTTVSSGFNSTAQINENFTKIVDAINNTLSRDGSVPNNMDALLDMNSNRIVNVADPVDAGDVVTLTYFQNNPGANTFTDIAVSGEPTVSALSAGDTLTLIEGSNITITNVAASRTVRFDAVNTVTNAFSTIQVAGQGDIDADSTSDTLTVAAGSGISLATVPGTDTLTITATATDQDLWETITADVGGNLTPASPTDTLNFVGGTNVTVTSNGTDTLTFDAVASSQNVFTKIAVSGEGDVDADSATDTLTLVAGSGINITTTPGTDTVTFASTAINVGATAFTTEEFTDGVGFTAGVSNSITLGTTPFAKESCLIFFKGLTQHVPEFSLAGNVVTFTQTIPAGVTDIQVYILSDPVYGQFATIPDQTISSAGTFTVAHGLTAAPTQFELSLVCTTGEANYGIGDVVPIPVQSMSANRGVALRFDGTNVVGRFGSDANVFEVLDFTTGATTTLTNGNWDLRIRVLG